MVKKLNVLERVLVMSRFNLLSAALLILVSVQVSSIKLEDLLDFGCTPCFTSKFGTAPSECHGTYLFVGALNSSNSVFHRGTYGFSQAAIPKHPREIIWNFSPGFSFGLSVDSPTLLEDDATFVGLDRIELDRYRRLDSALFYQHTSSWIKMVFNCPGQSCTFALWFGELRRNRNWRSRSWIYTANYLCLLLPNRSSFLRSWILPSRALVF